VSYSRITIAARHALLDALVALRLHRDALVLVGSQAIYLYTGDADVPIATTTKDSDIVVLPQMLGDYPLLDDAMEQAGFHRDLQGLQGQWLDRDGIPVELLVPAALEPSGKRGARIPPHDNRSGLRGSGLATRISTVRSSAGSKEVTTCRRWSTAAASSPDTLSADRLSCGGMRAPRLPLGSSAAGTRSSTGMPSRSSH